MGVPYPTDTVRVVSDGEPIICVLGDYAWDVLIRTNTELLRGGDTFGEVVLLPGGSAANVAVWAARCGREVTFIGKIGRDRMGALGREDLEGEGVDHRLIETDAHATGSVAVFVDHTGERSMVSGHGADFYLLPSELPRRAIDSAAHLHLTAWSFFTDPPRSAAREAARTAKAGGSTVSFDPGSFQMIDEMGVDAFLSVTTDMGVDLFLPNKEEASVLTGIADPEAAGRRLVELFGGALVVLKLDAEGALVVDGDTISHIPPSSNRLVDATGAGDSFAGAFLSRWTVGTSAPESASFAVRVAEWVIGHPGARPAPDLALRSVLG